MFFEPNIKHRSSKNYIIIQVKSKNVTTENLVKNYRAKSREKPPDPDFKKVTIQNKVRTIQKVFLNEYLLSSRKNQNIFVHTYLGI